MHRSLAFTALAAALFVGGCADPADDVTKATVNAPAPGALGPAPGVGARAEAEKNATTAAAAPAAAPTATAAALPAPPAGALELDPASKIDFTGSKVTGKHDGGFKTFKGYTELSSDKKTVTKLAVEIDTNSLWSDNEKLTGHLKAPDFFDVAKFPTATFVTTEIKPGGEKGATHTLTGDLTLHGTTKSISFPATVKVADGGLALTSEFAINRKDFGITYAGMTNDLIRDNVVIKLDVKTAKKG